MFFIFAGKMPNLNELYLSDNQIGAKGFVDWRWLYGEEVKNMFFFLAKKLNDFHILTKFVSLDIKL